MRLRQHGFGLPIIALALTVAAPKGVLAQAAYLERFMQICEKIVMETAPGKPPAAVCECTARRGIKAIAAKPELVSAILQGVQAHHGFSLNVISSLPPEQQQARFSPYCPWGRPMQLASSSPTESKRPKRCVVAEHSFANSGV